MSGDYPRDAEGGTISVTCPECKAMVILSEKEAERTMQARCPKGHVIPLAKALS